MEEEDFDNEQFEEFQKLPLKDIFQMYKSLKAQKKSLATQNETLATQNNTLIQKNQKNEAVIRQMMNERIYYVNKNIYESYDSTQSEGKEIIKEVEIDESISKTMLEKIQRLFI